MVGNPGSTKISSGKPFVNMTNRLIRAQTGIGFYKDTDAQVQSVPNYRNSNKTKPVNSRLAGSINALNRSQSNKQKMRQYTAGANKQRQETKNAFEIESSSIQDAFKHEVNHSSTNDMATGGVSQKTHVTMENSELMHGKNSPYPFDNVRISQAALIQPPSIPSTNHRETSKSSNVRLKDGSKNYKSMERRIQETKNLLLNQAKSAYNNEESQDSNQESIGLENRYNAQRLSSESRLILGLQSTYGQMVDDVTKDIEEGMFSDRLQAT